MKTRPLLLLLILLLSSCSTVKPALETNSLLNKEMRLNSARFLSETRYSSWVSWTLTIDTRLISYPGRADCRGSNNCLPTLNEYAKNSHSWQQWQDRNGAQFRILGLLPAGTQYHFYNVVVPAHWTDAPPIYYVVIDSGLFKGVTAYFSMRDLR